jgi:hypothetical protein
MAIKSVVVNGQNILIEVNDKPVDFAEIANNELELTGMTDRFADSGPILKLLLESVCLPVSQALSACEPAEWGMEINIGFEGEAGIPFISKGSANGSIKVKAIWKDS